MPDARQARGRRTQVVIAAWLREHGWDRARAPVGAETGQDIKDLPVGMSVEIKARTDFNPLSWLRQAMKNARPGDRPVVVIRCNGQGEDADNYLVIRRLADDELAYGPSGSLRLRSPASSELVKLREQYRLLWDDYQRISREQDTVPYGTYQGEAHTGTSPAQEMKIIGQSWQAEKGGI